MTARELIEEAEKWLVKSHRSYKYLIQALAVLDAEQKIVICSKCGRTANWHDEDDFGSLGSDSGICCHDCGNEEFLTIKEVRTKYVAEQKEKEQVKSEAREVYRHVMWVAMEFGKVLQERADLQKELQALKKGGAL